jgi:SAM-dependent methyltransferase
MWADVVDLHEFYRSRQGVMVQRLVRRRLRAIWPTVRGETVIGVGYATPYLPAFAAEAERAVALMPAPQGVVHWPADGPNAVALAEEAQLPLPDLAADRIVMVHMLEFSGHLPQLLRELWRVLAGGGRLMVLVPNRRSIWARMEGTPFSQGRPYSMGQLTRLLRDNMFTPVHTDRALHQPPLRSRMFLRAAPAWEKVGARWFPAVGGVNIVEATKQIYAGTPLRAAARTRLRPVPALGGAHHRSAARRR